MNRTCWLPLVLVATVFSCAAQDAAPLGSTSFIPTPENPIGWRGDGTGRYPGATPPLRWSRRALGFTADLKYQAAKPVGEPGADARPLEYFVVKDWLVAGPFPAPDPAKDIDTDFLKGETAVQPNAGDKAGDAAWKFHHIGMDSQSTHVHNGGIVRHLNLDFVDIYATISRVADPKDNSNIHTKYEGDLANKVAYAHTYVYSPADGDAVLTVAYAAAGARVWFNGKPVTLDNNNKTSRIDVTKGWNRLLVKLSTATPPVAANGGVPMVTTWRFAAYITPSKPVTYETKNIAWMTRVTGRSMSNPILVGDKIFAGSGVSDLMCFNKADGKVRWLHSSTPWDAMTAEEKQQHKDALEAQITQLEQLDAEAVTLINAGVSPQGLNLAQQTELDKKLKAKFDFERGLHQAFWKIDAKRYPPMTGNEVSSSNATPCSDGARVYWASGGGMKGSGASVVVCFDLDGKRLWTYHEPFGAAEHGLHTSPQVVDGKLIYAAYKTLIAFDAPTGKVLWKQPTAESGGASPQVVKIGNESAVYIKHNGRVVGLYRVSDGSRIAANDMGTFGDSTPIVENGVIYVSDKFKRWSDNNVAFSALQLPTAMPPAAAPAAPPAQGNKTELKQLFELDSDKVYVPSRGIFYFVASPLFVDGIVYSLDMSGGLSAVDAAGKTGLYHRWLDWYDRYDRYLYGAVASPTLAGKNIYFVDDAGYTIVMQPGKDYKEVARNVIENTFPASEAGNPCKQEAFYSSPVFEGASLYLKGEEYLYCIRETK